MKILIDNGHGRDTKGKRSPDGRIFEWKWTREVAELIVAELRRRGYDAQKLVPEDTDIKLSTRVERANAWCRKIGSSNVVLISVHINAAGAGDRWLSARGWTGWVSTKASIKSKNLAQILYGEAEKRGLKGNRSVPPCRYWTADFTITTKTSCPAVLTENLFQDNKDDVDYLASDAGKRAIADLHVAAIETYIKTSK